VKVLFVTDKF